MQTGMGYKSTKLENTVGTCHFENSTQHLTPQRLALCQSSVFQGCYFTLPPSWQVMPASLCILRTIQACQTHRNLMMLDVALSLTRRSQNKTRHQPIMNPQESSVLPHRQLRGDSHATRSAPRALDCPDWHHKSSQRWPRLQPLRNPNEPK